jgi:ABC-type antimicrobial peptide transport system permease subunit
MLEVPGLRYAEVVPMASVVDRMTRSWRLGATVFSLFGLVALAVAAVGLYGVLAYDVARRRREIGIRMALGARRGRVMGGVLLAALLTVGGGLAVALPVAAWGSGRLGPLLFQVSPRDPKVFALAAGLLLVTATLAALVPAWRATRVDPRDALSEG